MVTLPSWGICLPGIPSWCLLLWGKNSSPSERRMLFVLNFPLHWGCVVHALTLHPTHMHNPVAFSPLSIQTLHTNTSHTPNFIGKGQAGASSSSPEERETYCHCQSVNLQLGWPEDRPRVLCNGAQVTFTVSSQGTGLWGTSAEKSRALCHQPCFFLPSL